MSRTATKVYFEYDDGFAEVATGEHAAEVMRYLESAQWMLQTHGGKYSGKQMEQCAPIQVGWQAIDSAPVNVAVLAYVPDDYGVRRAKALLTADGNVDWWCGLTTLKPTHWMMLPDPPTEVAACARCGCPKERHRPEAVAHHSECTLEQYTEATR